MPKNKRGKISNVEKFYIQENPKELSTAALARELNRTTTQVEQVMKSKTKVEAKPQKKPSKKPETKKKEQKKTIKPKANQGPKVKDLMGKNDRGSTVMTGSASELSDETRAKRVRKQTRVDSAIYRPLDDNN